jgi:hypothetical protein
MAKKEKTMSETKNNEDSLQGKTSGSLNTDKVKVDYTELSTSEVRLIFDEAHRTGCVPTMLDAAGELRRRGECVDTMRLFESIPEAEDRMRDMMSDFMRYIVSFGLAFIGWESDCGLDILDICVDIYQMLENPNECNPENHAYTSMAEAYTISITRDFNHVHNEFKILEKERMIKAQIYDNLKVRNFKKYEMGSAFTTAAELESHLKSMGYDSFRAQEETLQALKHVVENAEYSSFKRRAEKARNKTVEAD